MTSKKAFKSWSLVVVSLLIISSMVAGCAPAQNAVPETTTAPEVTPLPLDISVDEANTLYNNGVFLLDVRTPEEWNEIHIPNTTLIPLDQLEARLSEVPTDQPVVVICRSGNRSKVGRDTLLNAGYENVTSINGGIKEWESSGYPVTSGP